MSLIKYNEEINYTVTMVNTFYGVCCLARVARKTCYNPGMPVDVWSKAGPVRVPVQGKWNRDEEGQKITGSRKRRH